MHRVRERDQAAWDRLVDLYGPIVFKWCRQAGLQDADAADVGQEVFAAVYAGIDGFRRGGPGETFRGWLRGITRFKVADFWRRKQRTIGEGVGGDETQTFLTEITDRHADESGAGDQPGEERQLYLRAVELILSECKEIVRQIFVRVVIDQQSPKLVAEELGVSLNVVYLATSRVKQQMREEFDELLELESEKPDDDRPGE
ncbi:RNA polymerase sigma factor [Fimbriiglobus ruber]|uniref:Transcriptional control n=1 Tax=Fimbriiglobus ruber TaxID=1908690 RepID=A0A225E9T5_9BACT|nr:RNA polymerase sigma factor [Fimbriiglobus ruber]OWK45335.1 transcriptional control [Fimbriiglobus ruber]